MPRRHSKKPQRPHRTYRPHHHHLGVAPGSLFDDPEAPLPVISVMGYSEDRYVEQPLDEIEGLPLLLKEWPVVWVDVQGPGNATLMRRLGDLFDFHRLALEDVLHGHQTPKIESYADFFLIVANEVCQPHPLHTTPLCLFVKHGLVLTFHPEKSIAVDVVREHVRVPRGRVRAMGADFLAYAVLDLVVDFYYPVMDHFSDTIEVIEAEVLETPSASTASSIHEMKQDLLTLRRMVSPLRESTNTLIRDGHPVLTDATRLFLRDCHDHMVHVMEFIESYRELMSGLLDIYLSSVSNRMNEVMRVLTVISTIFIPLTFITGLYGMNFDTSVSPWNMPELEWRWGYLVLLLVLTGITSGQLVFYWRKGWIGRRRSFLAPQREEKPKEDSQ